MSATESPSEQAPFYAVLGRALADEKYRAQLTDSSDPEGQKRALMEMGVEKPDDHMLEHLNKTSQALNELADVFGPDAIAAT